MVSNKKQNNKVPTGYKRACCLLTEDTWQTLQVMKRDFNMFQERIIEALLVEGFIKYGYMSEYDKKPKSSIIFELEYEEKKQRELEETKLTDYMKTEE